MKNHGDSQNCLPNCAECPAISEPNNNVFSIQVIVSFASLAPGTLELPEGLLELLLPVHGADELEGELLVPLLLREELALDLFADQLADQPSDFLKYICFVNC